MFPAGDEHGVIMTLSELELQRARKQLETCCRQRNAQGNDAARWCLSEAGGAFEIRECAGDSAVLRLCFQDGRWLLFVPAAEGGWRSYPPRPEAATIDAVINELEQAPLHIHW